MMLGRFHNATAGAVDPHASTPDLNAGTDADHAMLMLQLKVDIDTGSEGYLHSFIPAFAFLWRCR